MKYKKSPRPTVGRRPSMKTQIVQLACRLFTEVGYSGTSASMIGRLLDISTGNITFYFPSKDHLLAVVVDELFNFQSMMMDQAAEEGKSSLLAYCLELSSIAAACEESDLARDFYKSAYTSPITLDLIRRNDTKKTMEVFKSFRPDWTEEEWIATENMVSGIEFATVMTSRDTTPLPKQIEKTLDSIMLLYGVPEDLRRIKINKVLSMDYRSIGLRMLVDFKEYMERVNEENVVKSMTQKRPYNRKQKKDTTTA